MNADEERTRDIYEIIPGYPKPPSIPLPEPGDLSSLESMGLMSRRFSRGVVKAAIAATGFTAFQRKLPQRIDELLRQSNLRGSYLFGPVISATLALEDDPRELGPIERAATLLMAARNLYEDISSGRLTPDSYRGQVLEMGQYPNLFSTCLVVDGKKPRIFKSTNVSQIAVAVHRRFYALNVWDAGSETTTAQLVEALAALARSADGNRLASTEPSPGVLTCADHGTQCKAFRELQKNAVNAESLAIMRHSFLTVCLDLDSEPASDAEAARMAQSGNCENRWFHSSLQLVIFGNGKACVICNFSTYLDGNTMMRAASELQKRAERCALGSDHKDGSGQLPAAVELAWKIDAKLVRRGYKDLRSVLDNQPATFELAGVGNRLFTELDLDPIPSFVLAVQMTAQGLTRHSARITQFLTMSKYCCSDLTCAIVTTPEMLRFVDYIDGADTEADCAQRFLHEALESQVRECRKARRHLDFNDILSLFGMSLKGARRFYVLLVGTLAIAVLGGMGLFRPVDIVVSHPEIYPEVPVVGRPGIRLPYLRCFGLHYQIFENKIVVTLMPSVTWTVPNAELIAELGKNLKRIQLIACRAN